MKKSIAARQEKRGRPATGRTPSVTMRLPAALTDRVDVWAKGQPDEPVRSEAIRRLLEIALSMKPRQKPPSVDRAARAKELAAKTIDRLIDPSATTDDKVGRKRRLLKGPEEFRNLRLDASKGTK